MTIGRTSRRMKKASRDPSTLTSFHSVINIRFIDTVSRLDHVIFLSTRDDFKNYAGPSIFSHLTILKTGGTIGVKLML